MRGGLTKDALIVKTYVQICWSRNIISVTVTPVPRGRATIDLVKAQGPTGTSREDPDQTNRDQQAGTLVRDQQGPAGRDPGQTNGEGPRSVQSLPSMNPLWPNAHS